MAYQTGLTAGPNDLLNTLRDFCVNQGWTVNRFSALGNGSQLCISLNDAYFNFRSLENDSSISVNEATSVSNFYGILLNGSDGFDSGLAWDRQPNYPRRINPQSASTNQLVAGIFRSTTTYRAYHFFAPSPKTIYVEVEIELGIFERFGFGSLDLFNPGFADAKSGRFFYGSKGNSAFSILDGMDASNSPELIPFRNAHYSTSGSHSGSYLRVKTGSFDNWATSCAINSNSLTGQSAMGSAVSTHTMRELSLSPLNGSAILYPSRVSVVNSNVSISPVGMMPDMRFLDMSNYLTGDEFNFGPDTYKVFPWYQKSGYSLQRGIAYKKVV